MTALLAEFSGVATVSPTDQTKVGFSVTSIINLAMASADAAFGDLLALGTVWLVGTGGTVSFTDTFNNGAAAISLGSGQVSAGGLPDAVNFVYGIVPGAALAQPLGVQDWAYDVTATAAPVAGSQASVVLPAVTGKAYVLASLVAVMRSGGTADSGIVQVLDGANIIFQGHVGIQAGAGTADRIALTNLAIRGTAGNSMTVRFAAAPAAANLQSIFAGAYLR